MESTSEPGRIHMSKAAAELVGEQAPELRTFITPRAEPVQVKGKGTMSTYWLNTGDLKLDPIREVTQLL